MRRPAVVVAAVAGDVDHQAFALVAAAAEQLHRIVDGAGDRGAAVRLDRHFRELAGEGVGRGRVLDQRPADQRELQAGGRPLDVAERDAAVVPRLDRLDDARIGQGLDIALALETRFVRVDRARDVDREDELEIHGKRCGGRRRQKKGEEREDPPHGRSLAQPHGGCHAGRLRHGISRRPGCRGSPRRRPMNRGRC